MAYTPPLWNAVDLEFVTPGYVPPQNPIPLEWVSPSARRVTIAGRTSVAFVGEGWSLRAPAFASEAAFAPETAERTPIFTGAADAAFVNPDRAPAFVGASLPSLPGVAHALTTMLPAAQSSLSIVGQMVAARNVAMLGESAMAMHSGATVGFALASQGRAQVGYKFAFNKNVVGIFKGVGKTAIKTAPRKDAVMDGTGSGALTLAATIVLPATLSAAGGANPALRAGPVQPVDVAVSAAAALSAWGAEVLPGRLALLAGSAAFLDMETRLEAFPAQVLPPDTAAVFLAKTRCDVFTRGAA